MSDFIRMSGHYVNVSQMLHMKMTEGADKDRVDVEVVYPTRPLHLPLSSPLMNWVRIPLKCSKRQLKKP